MAEHEGIDKKIQEKITEDLQELAGRFTEGIKSLPHEGERGQFPFTGFYKKFC